MAKVKQKQQKQKKREQCRLEPFLVFKIRQWWISGWTVHKIQKHVARMYSEPCAISTIYAAARGETWKEVPFPAGYHPTKMPGIASDRTNRRPLVLCKAGDCRRPVLAKGLCRKHYKRFWTHGVYEDKDIPDTGHPRAKLTPNMVRSIRDLRSPADRQPWSYRKITDHVNSTFGVSVTLTCVFQAAMGITWKDT